MTTHLLKTDPKPFEDVACKMKHFEIRQDDRCFNVGDVLVLQKTEFTGEQMKSGSPLHYTGDMCVRKVTHIMRGAVYGLKDGWVIMSIEP